MTQGRPMLGTMTRRAPERMAAWSAAEPVLAFGRRAEALADALVRS